MNNKSGYNKELLDFFNNMIEDETEKEILKTLLVKKINDDMIADLLEIVETVDD